MADRKPWEEFSNTESSDVSAEKKPWEAFGGETKPEPKGFLGHARDLGLSAVKSAIAVPETVVGLADIPTGGRVGKFLENEGGAVGFRPKQAKEFLSEFHSEGYKEQQRQFQDADGILDKTAVAVQNPSLVANVVTESIAPMLAGGVAARGLMAGTRLGQMGGKGAAAAGAIGEGTMMAGAQAEAIRQETDDGLLTPTQAGAAVATGALGTLFGYLGGRVAQRFGLGDIDTMLARGANPQRIAGEISALPAKSIPRQVVEGAISEGFLEELPQSISEQIIQNLALGKQWSEGVEDAAVMGTLAGMAMGGGASLYNGMTRPEAPTGEAPPPQAAGTPPAGPQGFTPATERPIIDEAALGRAGVYPPAPPPIINPRNLEPAAATPSQKMGLDPNAGPMSAAAALAVDSGASPVAPAAPQAAAPTLAQAAQVGGMSVDPETGEILEASPRVQVGQDAEGWVNQNAQMARDQADKSGLTGTIEDLFAQGLTANQVLNRIKAQVGFVDPHELPSWVVGVRATLGIPSQMDEEGKGEFAAWQDQYRRRKGIEQSAQAVTPTAEFAPEDRSIYELGDEPVAVKTENDWRFADMLDRLAEGEGWLTDADAERALGFTEEDESDAIENAEGNAGLAEDDVAGRAQTSASATAPSAPAQATGEGQEGLGQIDVSGRTPEQLQYLATNGQPGWKEAAQAEMQRRSAQPAAAPELETQPAGADAPAMATPQADAAPVADIKAVIAKQIPDMTDGEQQPATVTREGVDAVKRQTSEILSKRLQGMKAGAVNQFAARFLPTMGLKPTASKERNIAMLTDGAKVNLLGVAGELGVELSPSFRQGLEADMTGTVADRAATPDPKETGANVPTAEQVAPQAQEAGGQEGEKAKWIKATVDKSRLNGSSGVQLAVSPNGGVTFQGNPNTSKDGKALLANYEKALAAGATQQEIAAALQAQQSKPAAAKFDSQSGTTRTQAERALWEKGADAERAESDVGVTAGTQVRFVSLADAVATVREAEQAGVAMTPFQVHQATGIRIGDAERVIREAQAPAVAAAPTQASADVARQDGGKTGGESVIAKMQKRKAETTAPAEPAEQQKPDDAASAWRTVKSTPFADEASAVLALMNAAQKPSQAEATEKAVRALARSAEESGDATARGIATFIADNALEALSSHKINAGRGSVVEKARHKKLMDGIERLRSLEVERVTRGDETPAAAEQGVAPAEAEATAADLLTPDQRLTFDQWLEQKWASNRYRDSHLENAGGDEQKAKYAAASGGGESESSARNAYWSALMDAPRDADVSLEMYDSLTDAQKRDASRHFFKLDDMVRDRYQREAMQKKAQEDGMEREVIAPMQAEVDRLRSMNERTKSGTDAWSKRAKDAASLEGLIADLRTGRVTVADLPAKWRADAAVEQDAAEAPAAPQAEEVADRDQFTVERVDGDQRQALTFKRGETVKVSGKYPMEVGEIDGISNARKEFRIGGAWLPFGYAYKAEYDEFAAPRRELEEMIANAEKRIADGAGFQRDGYPIRDAREHTKRYSLEGYDDTLNDLAKRGQATFDRSVAEDRARMAAAEQTDRERREAADAADAAKYAGPVKMTMDEWKRIGRDFKSFNGGNRTVMQDGRIRRVEIVKAKAEAPDAEESAGYAAQHEALMASVRTGKATPEAFKASFEQVVANEAAIKAELSAKTKAELLREGSFMDPSLPVQTGVNARMVVIDRPAVDGGIRQQGDADPEVAFSATLPRDRNAVRIGITEKGLVRAMRLQFDGLADVTSKLLERGRAGKRGGVIVLGTADNAEIGRIVAERTGRKLDATMRKFSSAGRINGFYDPKTGLTFLVGPNLNPVTATAVMLHEMLHGQQRQMIDARALEMVRTRHGLKDEGLRSFLDRVMLRMIVAGEAGNAAEAAAYIVEQAVIEGRSAGYAFADNAFMQWVDAKIGKRVGDFLRSFAGMIRTWMLRNGLGAKTMTVDDFVGYAMAGLDRAAAGEVRAGAVKASASIGARAPQTEAFHRSVGDAPAQEAQRVQSAIEGKTLIEAAQFMTRSKDGAKAAVAQKVLEKLQRLEKAGVVLDLKVVHRGDMAPASMVNARGYTETGFDEKGRDIVVWLNGADVTGKVGTEEEVLLHELVHAATAGMVFYGTQTPNSMAGKHARDLMAVTDAIAEHIRKRFDAADAGKAMLTAFEQDMREGANNAFRSDDEVLAWALSSGEAQAYLETIPYRSGSMWSNFVQAVRNLLGLSARNDTALSEVLRVAERILTDDAPNAGRAAFWHKRNIRMAQQQVRGSIAQTAERGGDDLQFSRSGMQQAARNIGAGLKAITVQDVKKAGKHKLTDWLRLGLQFLGRRQLTDIYGDVLPLADYDRLAAQMEADKNDVGAAADELARRWGKLPDEGKLADLMHDATLAQIDADSAVEYAPGDDLAASRALKAQFNQLSGEAQKVYREARDHYRKHHAEVRQAIIDRIMRSELREERRTELLKRMDADFFKAIKGVYFPLARFGQYVVVTKDNAGKVASVSRAETMAEAETMRAEMVKAFPARDGYHVGRVILSKEFVAGRDMVGRGFMTELYEALDEQGLDPSVQAELEDTLGQLYLSSLPDLSWAKHGIHRKGTPGFSSDARRAFAQNTFHGARYLAKLKYGDQMQAELDRMQKHVDEMAPIEGFDQPAAQRVVDEMNKRHEATMNPKGNPLSTALTSFGFVYYLGISPAAAVVNLSQTPLVAYPVMGAKWGFRKAGAALMTASKETMEGKNDLRSRLKSPDEIAAYDEAVRTGVIDVTMAHDLAGIAQGEDAKVMWKIRPVMRLASYLFHHAERFNRQATFLAAYRLARDAGAKHDTAYSQAVKATYDGHFDYSTGNRPRVMQGNVAKVVLLFKQYAQNMIYTLARNAYQSVKGESPEVRREARKVFGALMTMHAAAAGVLGLPMVGTLLTLASALGGSDDEPWDAEVALRNMLADTFGAKPAEVIARGFSRLTPWDISGRVGLDKLLLPDVNESLEGQRWAESFATAMLGPVIGMGVNAAKGAQKMADGDYGRGLEDMLPIFARNPIKAYRQYSEGEVDRTGVVIKDEVSLAGVLGQASGFSPSEIRLAFEGRSAVMSADRRLAERRQDLMTQFARAAMDQDQDGMTEARAAIADFNKVNPGRRITPPQMWQSVRNRERRIRDADQGVYLPRTRRDVMDEGRFAEVG